jgi:glycosyltransferase involved in cell wall biosynthesis
LKVLHVASGRLFGGVERMLVTLASCSGITPDVRPAFAVAAPGRLHEELTCTGAPVHLLGDVRLRRPESVIAARARLRRIVQRDRPDVLLCHAPWSYALFAPVGRREGVRLGLWQHDRATGWPILERLCHGTPADLVICNSRWTAASARFLQPHTRAFIVHCPVCAPVTSDVDRETIRRTFQTEPASVVILIASRMEAWKGHELLMQALHRLRRWPAWTLWIAGAAQRPHEDRYRRRLEREGRRLSIAERVRFVGEQSAVMRVMSAADILCQPNRSPEPFGLAFVEAMACGLPVITTRFGGAPEVVTTDVGRLVDPAMAWDLDVALIELIEDERLRQELAGAGRARAHALCSPEKVMPQLERILRTTVRAAAA